MKPEPDDIRRIVRAARPSGRDELDPEINAARDALADHPELAAELEDERLLDLKISNSFRNQDPPSELEARLLDTLRETRNQDTNNEESIVSGSFSRRHWLGLAAATAACVGAAMWWRTSQLLPVKRLVADLAKISRDGVTLSLMSMQTDEVVGWLVNNRAPRADHLPSKLDALGRKGCHIYNIEGHEVSLECFLLPGMRELHLFTTPTQNLSGAPSPKDHPSLQSVGDLTAALWTQGENTMILLSEEPKKTVGALLQA